jgi:hypothetical protein
MADRYNEGCRFDQYTAMYSKACSPKQQTLQKKIFPCKNKFQPIKKCHYFQVGKFASNLVDSLQQINKKVGLSASYKKKHEHSDEKSNLKKIPLLVVRAELWN